MNKCWSKILTSEKKIRLTASTEKDLKIISYLCQDAIFSKEEILFNKEKNYLLLPFQDTAGKKKKIILIKKMNLIIELFLDYK